MGVLRRYYHHHVKHHQRFHLAVMLTIVAVAYVAVPMVMRFIDSVANYDPRGYEPKDAQRTEWLAKTPFTLNDVTWENLFKVALFVLAGLAWLAVVPSRAPRPRSRR